MTSSRSGLRRATCAPTGLARRVNVAAGRDVLIACSAGVVTSTSPRLSRRIARTRLTWDHRLSIISQLRFQESVPKSRDDKIDPLLGLVACLRQQCAEHAAYRGPQSWGDVEAVQELALFQDQPE